MLENLKAGFKFQETMAGTYHLLKKPEEERHFSFSAMATVDNVMRYMRDMTATLDGTLEMEGFADHVRIEGTLEMNPLFGRVLRYQFTFVGNDGKTYRFAGQQDIRLFDLPTSMTTLPGSIYDDDGTEVAKVMAKFNLDTDFLPFLMSWRPVLPLFG